MKHFAVFLCFVVLLAGCAPQQPADDTVQTPTVSVLSQSGKMATVPLNAAKLTLDTATPDYGWAYYEGELYVTYEGEEISFERIGGSQRYMLLHKGHGVGMYTYLVNVRTGEVFDPLSSLDKSVLEYLSQVSFSADGQYALISHHSGTVLELMDISKGIKTQLPYDEGLYSVSGQFLDNQNVLICSVHQEADGKTAYSLSRYHIATGELTQLSGRYQAKDPTLENFMSMLDYGPFAYTRTDGKISVVDLRNFEKTVYALNAADNTVLIYHTQNSIHAVVGENKYLLKSDGTTLIIES